MICYCWYDFEKRWGLTFFYDDFSTKLTLCCFNSLLEENNEKQTPISADIEAV